MKIDILHTADCQNYEETSELVKAVVSDMGLNAQMRTVLVQDAVEAERLHFFGSPSVQINGVDVDLSVRDCEGFVFG